MSQFRQDYHCDDDKLNSGNTNAEGRGGGGGGGGPGALSAPERREPKVRYPPNLGAKSLVGNPCSPIDSSIVGSAFRTAAEVACLRYVHADIYAAHI